jgi:hypothetical protein
MQLQVHRWGAQLMFAVHAMLRLLCCWSVVMHVSHQLLPAVCMAWRLLLQLPAFQCKLCYMQPSGLIIVNACSAGNTRVFNIPCRMTQLQEIQLKIRHDSIAENQYVMCLDLHQLQRFMQALQRQRPGAADTLTLSTSFSWDMHSRVWQALGQLPQLRSLYIRTDRHDLSRIRMQHLSGLEPLCSSLQSLVIRTGRLQADQNYSAIGRLTNLQRA